MGSRDRKRNENKIKENREKEKEKKRIVGDGKRRREGRERKRNWGNPLTVWAAFPSLLLHKNYAIEKHYYFYIFSQLKQTNNTQCLSVNTHLS